MHMYANNKKIADISASDFFSDPPAVLFLLTLESVIQ